MVWNLADVTANPMLKVDDVTCVKMDFGISASQTLTDVKVRVQAHLTFIILYVCTVL